MTIGPSGQPGPSPVQALRNAGAVTLGGILVVLAAAVDPWLLVMLAGLAVTAFALLQEAGGGPRHPEPTWDML